MKTKTISFFSPSNKWCVAVLNWDRDDRQIHVKYVYAYQQIKYDEDVPETLVDKLHKFANDESLTLYSY